MEIEPFICTSNGPAVSARRGLARPFGKPDDCSSPCCNAGDGGFGSVDIKYDRSFSKHESHLHTPVFDFECLSQNTTLHAEHCNRVLMTASQLGHGHRSNLALVASFAQTPLGTTGSAGTAGTATTAPTHALEYWLLHRPPTNRSLHPVQSFSPGARLGRASGGGASGCVLDCKCAFMRFANCISCTLVN